MEGRPPPSQPFGLPLDFGPELAPLGAGQSLDPPHQVRLTIVHGQGGQAVGHGVTDGSDGDQLTEQCVHDGPAGQGHGVGALTELGGHVVGLAGQHPGQAALGHHQRPRTLPTTDTTSTLRP